MKLTIALLCVSLIGYVCAETCGDRHDCDNTKCHHSSHLICNNGYCECSMGSTGQACIDKPDCSSVDCSHHGDRHDAHCIDGHCQCTVRN